MILFLASLPPSPTSVSCNLLSNKLLALKFWSQHLFLGEAKLRQWQTRQTVPCLHIFSNNLGTRKKMVQKRREKSHPKQTLQYLADQQQENNSICDQDSCMTGDYELLWSPLRRLLLAFLNFFFLPKSFYCVTLFCRWHDDRDACLMSSQHHIGGKLQG